MLTLSDIPQVSPSAKSLRSTARDDRPGVMQIVDSLAAGGAERVAVNLANEMPRDQYRMFVCATRCEGPLAELIDADVGRLSLARQSRFDWRALQRLVAFIRSQRIRILHAHGTSLFIARVASLFSPWPAVVWHDHFGRCGMELRPAGLYRILTWRLPGVVAVNQSLADWSRCQLGVPRQRVWYVPNFVSQSPVTQTALDLPGRRGARMICVANFRPQKDHSTLLRALELLCCDVPEVHLLLVGDQVDARYTTGIRQEIESRGLSKNVSMLGCRTDVSAILRECDIGILSSASEGLPLALLEYGWAGLATVVTRVGQCAEVLDEGRCGVLVAPGAPEEMADAIRELFQNEVRRRELAQNLAKRVREAYSAEAAIHELGVIYSSILGTGC